MLSISSFSIRLFTFDILMIFDSCEVVNFKGNISSYPPFSPLSFFGGWVLGVFLGKGVGLGWVKGHQPPFRTIEVLISFRDQLSRDWSVALGVDRESLCGFCDE